MSKFFNIMTAVALAVASLSLSACSDDDKDDDGPVASGDLKSINWTATGSVNQEAVAVFDYDAYVTLPTGESVKLGGLEFGQQAKVSGIVLPASVSFPANFVLTIKRTVKSDYKVTDGAKLDLKEDFELRVELEDSKGNVLASKTEGHNENHKGLNLSAWLDKYGNETETEDITVKKDSKGYTLD